MTSFPPLSKEPETSDSLAQSLAVQRHKALGGRRTRTRQSPVNVWLSRPQSIPEDRSEKIGPRTVIFAPRSLLGRVLSAKEFLSAGDRFPITRHKEKRDWEARNQSSAVSTPPKVEGPPPDFIEEMKLQRSKESDLVDFAAKMKNGQAVLLFSTKTLGEGHRPEAREGASMVTINRKMYLFAGRCRMLFNDLKCLDPETLKWEAHKYTPTLEGPPEPRVSHTAVAYKNLMVIYGGCDRFNDILQFRNCFQLVHLYDTTLVGKMMFFYGGIDRMGKTLEDLQGLDLGQIYAESMIWFTPQVVKRWRPGPRSACTLTSVYNPQVSGLFNFDIFNPPKVYDEVFTLNTCGLYLIGGLTDKGTATNDVYILKAKKKTIKDDRPTLLWLKLDISGVEPEPRHSHCACLCGKFIFVMGGRNDSIYGQECHCELKSIALLNIESQRWDKFELYGRPPSGRWGFCMSAIGSKLVVFGGLKLEKYCGSKLYMIETDQTLVHDLIAKWKEQQLAIKRQADITAAFNASIAARVMHKQREMRYL